MRDDDGLTVADLCNRFLTTKLRKKESAELTQQTFADYKIITDLIVATFGGERLVDDLAADDFAHLRLVMAKRWGPERLGNSIVRVRSVFKHGIENGLIEKAVRYGSEFKKPGEAALRMNKAASGERMLEPEQLRKIIETAPTQLKAMVLLGLNAGLGNTDCASLPLSAVNIKTAWLNYPRPKTGVGRRSPLWDETIDAFKRAVAERPESASSEYQGLVSLNPAWKPWIAAAAYRQDYIAYHFSELLKSLGLHRPRIGFYTLRHVFRTVADAARDPVAIDIIMGHSDPSMGGHHRERVDDARLVTVVNVVRAWLWPSEPATETDKMDP